MIKRWEVTVSKFENSVGEVYKVTRHMPSLHVTETKTFRSKEKAKEQYEQWLE